MPETWLLGSAHPTAHFIFNYAHLLTRVELEKMNTKNKLCAISTTLFLVSSIFSANTLAQTIDSILRNQGTSGKQSPKHVTIQLIDVSCGDTEDTAGGDEFYIVGALTDGTKANTKAVLTIPMDINDGQIKSFRSDRGYPC
jgi:hypothetical protein